jgi:hypothetical protein
MAGNKLGWRGQPRLSARTVISIANRQV